MRSAKDGRAEVLPALWLILGILSHTAWGGYPVLARYIQTVGGVPPLAMTGIANGIATLGLLLVAMPRLKGTLPVARDLVFFGIVVVARSLSNVLAARFTSAIHVQLLSLMTPFFTALLSRPLLGERLPRFTLPAVFLSILGSVLMVTSTGKSGEIAFSLSSQDWLGLGLASASAFLLSFYMITIRKVVRQDTSAETLGAFQTIVLLVCMTSGSLFLGEDWGFLTRLPTQGWIAIIVYGLGVILAGTLIQNSALKRIPASVYTVMLSWRLVSTSFFAFLILGEKFTSLWQVFGALLVMVTVTLYSGVQRGPAPSSIGRS